ncbi:MAG: hypothetical protein QM621_09665 [Aeromicrobium sp.]|uniref:hypothetical protein n=1 Tax=Aeromicrobium sp. TaxID=1871063 RepID=UPI0039E24431
MSRLVVVPLALLSTLALGACGGGSGASGDPTPTATATSSAAPEALSNLSCAAGSDGLWNATGVIENSGDEPASFTVDVYIGPVDGAERLAQRTRVENIQPGGAAPLEVTGLSAQGDPASCHVRVLRESPAEPSATPTP